MPSRSPSTTWLADAARADPGALAVAEAGGDALSYGELQARAGALAVSLPPGEGPIGLELLPGIAHAVAVHAAMLSGRAFLTIRPGLPEPERLEVLTAAEPSVVLDAEAVAAAGGGRGSSPPPEPPAPPPHATLARVLSSGTSGQRRPVDLSFANFAASARASAANLGVRERDVWLACLPMDHVGGLSILVRSAIYGSAALIHPRFEAEAVASALAADEPRVTLVSLVPTQLRRLLEIGAPLHRLRAALIGGAALDDGTLARALDAGAPVIQTYGLTEACSQVCTLAPGEAAAHRGSSGRALPGIEVTIGDAGTIRVRGEVVAAGAVGEDGWLETNDLGRMDEDGYLWVEGRADDVIVSGGENVSPDLVEAALLAFPAVAEAAAVGRPDPEWGEAVVAYVVPGPSAEPEAAQLIAHCRERLAPAMVPKAVEIVPELPRTSSGKVQRARLRERASG